MLVATRALKRRRGDAGGGQVGTELLGYAGNGPWAPGG